MGNGRGGLSSVHGIIFELAHTFLGTDIHETAVFENAYHAARTAKKAGFYVVSVYDKSVYDKYEKRTKRIQEFTDRYVNVFSEWEEGKSENSFDHSRK